MTRAVASLGVSGPVIAAGSWWGQLSRINGLQVGDYVDVRVRTPGTISDWDVETDGDATSSIVIGVLKGTWSDYKAGTVPTSSIIDTGSGGVRPNTSSAKAADSSSLTHWTTTLAVDDMIRFSVVSVTNVRRARITLGRS